MPAKKKPTEEARTETVTVRLDPKLHYLAGIAARESAARTLSGFIEWALRRTMSDAASMRTFGEPMQGWPAPQPPLWMESLWDVEESDRFYNLATMAPGLLTIPEQRLWKLFTMHVTHIGRKLNVEAFREFWNDPSINTSHLKEDEQWPN